MKNALILLLFVVVLVSCQSEDKLRLEFVAELSGPDSQNEVISGASALIKYADQIMVIRDNANTVTVFDSEKFNFIQTIAIFPGSLPQNQRQRKKVKPDLEAAILLPHIGEHGSVLMIPSGSKKRRITGALMAMSSTGPIATSVKFVDFTSLYDELKKEFKKVNIEGVALIGEKLFLFQRGNSKKSFNAIVELNLSQIDFKTETIRIDAKAMGKIIKPDLGKANTIPFTFTDALALDEQNILFLAAAEETDDAYFDGDVSAAAIGVVNTQGEVLRMKQISPKIKIEGVAIAQRLAHNQLKLLVVSDADSDKVPGRIYSITINPSSPSLQ